MRRLAIVLSLLLLAALPAAAGAKVRKGPAGLTFYSPPHALVAGKHGSLIWARKLTSTPALHGGAGNRLILYRSTGVSGKRAVVSGTVSIPKGKAPKGGWPSSRGRTARPGSPTNARPRATRRPTACMG